MSKEGLFWAYIQICEFGLVISTRKNFEKMHAGCLVIEMIINLDYYGL